jgi:HEAT repeat protein
LTGVLTDRLLTLNVVELEPAPRAFVLHDRRRARSLVLNLLDRPDSAIRQVAACYLWYLGSERAFRETVALMRYDPDPTTRQVAAYHLAFSHDERAYDSLLETFSNADEAAGVRSQAAEGLAYLLHDARTRRFRHAARALVDALQDDVPEVRFWSAFALGSMRARVALPALRRLVEADDAMCPGWWPVRDEASDAIARIEGRPSPDRFRQGQEAGVVPSHWCMSLSEQAEPIR